MENRPKNPAVWTRPWFVCGVLSFPWGRTQHTVGPKNIYISYGYSYKAAVRGNKMFLIYHWQIQTISYQNENSVSPYPKKWRLKLSKNEIPQRANSTLLEWVFFPFVMFITCFGGNCCGLSRNTGSVWQICHSFFVSLISFSLTVTSRLPEFRYFVIFFPIFCLALLSE